MGIEVFLLVFTGKVKENFFKVMEKSVDVMFI